MADSFSVRAVLSAADSGFSSTLKSCSSVLDKLGNKISGFSFGLLTGAGQAAFSSISNGVKDLVGEINSSNKAWKTFDGNMKILGKSEKEIKSVKKTLQDYAQTTVYSSSDMASSYAQLAAVGIEGADQLVKGFGGLAGAAENPAQAMKTLSQQGVQMAAKPTVAWQDFKLMLEQTPAGIAAVAKEMGMSTDEMVMAVQDGEIATQDFFNAVQKVGTSDGFTKLATEYKSVDQAMDGLKETLGNKLMPAFDMVSQIGIKAISGITDKLDGIDITAITDGITTVIDRVTEFGKKAMLYIDAAKEAFDGVGTAVGDACSAVRESLMEAFGSTESVDGFKGAMEGVADIIKKVAEFATEHSDDIATLIMNLPKIAIAIKGFQVAKTVAPFVSKFATSIGSLAAKGIGGIASKLFGISKSQTQVGTTSQVSGAQMLTAAKAYALMGVAVLTIAVGFALLAQSAIALANAGGLAIGVMAGMVVAVVGIGAGMALLLKTLAPMSGQLMPVATAFLAMGAAVLLVSIGFAILAASSIALANAGGGAIAIMAGMVVAIALLAVGAAALGTALTAGAVGFLAFGAAVLMVGAGFALIGVAALLAATALTIIAGVLPSIAESGLQGAVAIAALGASLYVFAVGAGLAGAACLVLAAGLIAVGVALVTVGIGLTVVAAGMLIASASTLAFAASSVALGAGLLLVAVGLTTVSVLLLTVTAGTLLAVAGFTLLLAMSAALSATALVLTASLVALAAGTLAADVAIVAFGVSMAAGAVGVLAMAAALKGINSSMKDIAKNAKSAETSLDSMQASVSAVESGLSAIGSKAKTAMNDLKNAFDNTASEAKSAGERTGSGFANGLNGGLTQATSNVKSASSQIIAVMTMTVSNAASSGQLVGSGFAIGVQGGMLLAVAVASSGVVLVAARLRSGYSGAYSAGAYISQGFAAGMRSQLGAIRSAAAEMAAAADKAVRAKAKIHSPSKVASGLGSYWGEGFAHGISDERRNVLKAAENLVALPEVATHDLSSTYSGELSEDYEYFRNAEYIFTIPFDIDGREFARATVKYSQDELDRRQERENRKSGKV